MSNKMQEEFEAWVSKSKVCISKGARVEVRADGHYKDGRVDLQWKAWKASRAEIVNDVESGEWTDEQCGEFLSVALRHCDVRGRVVFDEIRQGVSAANSLEPKP